MLNNILDQTPVNNINIYNFRNIKNLSFQPSPGINIIYGDNAKGKTNLIESIWMFTGEKSFRKAKESQLIYFGEQNARLDLNFFAENRFQTATIKWNPKKIVYLNNCKIEKLPDFIGIFSSIIFSPEDLNLIKGNSQKRRNFLDVALSQIKPRYSKLLLNYNKILLQRNSLLKDITTNASLIDTLDIWDDAFSKTAAHITKYRFKYLKALLPIVEEIYSEISNQKERLKIKYISLKQSLSTIDLNCINYEDLYNYFYSNIINNRCLDIKYGYTQIGPHRDDFDIMINGLSAKNFASQGQQRSIVLVLKLAEAKILKNLVNKNPVILLDDVMSELDLSRQKYILNNLVNSQCFITCCNKNYFKHFSHEIHLYKIDQLIK